MIREVIDRSPEGKCPNTKQYIFWGRREERMRCYADSG